MNDLPDELLDDIAHFAEPNALRALALLERKWYSPARKEMAFVAEGFKRLLAFADVLLERPAFANLVRHARLDGASTSARESFDQPPCNDLISRALVIIIEACPNIRILNLGAVSVSIASQRQLMSAIGELRHLSELQPAHPSGSLHSSAFLKAAPALQSLKLLKVGFTFNEDDSPALPPLLCCNVVKMVLYLLRCTMSDIAVVLEALASQASHLSLFIMQPRGGDDDCTEPANRNKFNEILLPFVTQSDVLQLLISETKNQPDTRHLLDWPPRRGGVCLFIHDTARGHFNTSWHIGVPEACLECFARMMPVAVDAVRKQAWARQGDGWMSAHARTLEVICSANSVELVWE